MAVKHRMKTRQVKRVAIVATATATVSALTVGAAPAPVPEKRIVDGNVDLAAAIQLLPDSGQYPNPKTYPDLTGGLGTTIYDLNQTFADQLIRAIVNGVSLTALAQAAGVDPQSLVNTLLADIPSSLVPQIVNAIGSTINLPILGALTDLLSAGDLAVLTNVLDLLGLDEVTNGTLAGVLGLLGLSLADPFNLSNLTDDLGVNIITAGPTFTLLKLLGLDLGWVPSLPNSVADEINGSPYLEIGVNGILQLVIGKLQEAVDTDTLDLLNLDVLDDILGGLGIQLPLPTVPLADVVGGLIDSLGDLITPVTGALPDILHTRITPTVGIGLGAFAAAMAYQQVVDDLANQPGGTNYENLTGELNPLLGSLSILPMILINNPARPDGGFAARFGPLAALLGIDTVNPRTQLTGNGGIPVGNTGLNLGGANVLPILVDATYEYQPLSDFASWPNAFTLVNNLAAGLSPTYMLRGLDLSGVTGQLTPQLTAALADVAAGNPLALNLYLTLQSRTLPMLEPLYLASDFLNLVGLSPLAQIPMRIANALSPALKILTDVGYANTVRNPDGTYTRDFSTAGQEVPFLSFPNINPLQALGDSFTALVGGIQKELGPNPTPGTPNVLQTLLDAILGGGLGGVLPGTTPAPGTGTGAGTTGNPLTDLLGGLLGGLFGGLGLPSSTGSTLNSALAPSDVPESNARFSTLSISGGTDDQSLTGSDTSDDLAKNAGADEDAKSGDGKTDDGLGEDGQQSPASQEQPVEQKTPHESDGESGEGATLPAPQNTPEKVPAADPDDQGKQQSSVPEVKAPKHAKDDDSAPPPSGAAPKHAKPESPTTPSLNVVRDTANKFSPQDKPGPSAQSTTAGDEDTGTVDAGATAGAVTAGSPSEGGESDAA